ncbi:MAG: Holliday junction branch migration protein RuvA [Planctomycetota bacterium]|nr:MAG: Holliday junction branch migration protein RuvA [Planctomycetota bacterium]
MFEFLEGRVALVEPGVVVLAAGGVGWRLLVSDRTSSALRTGPKHRLLVHLAVSENAFTLYGFDSDQERWLFRQLLGVSGVGPASALGLLSGLGPESLAEAIRSRDLGRLTTVKGIGRKTAERLLVELGEAMEKNPWPSSTDAADLFPDDLLRVLGDLGFRPREAREAADRVWRELGPQADFQELLRAALQSRSSSS